MVRADGNLETIDWEGSTARSTSGIMNLFRQRRVKPVLFFATFLATVYWLSISFGDNLGLDSYGLFNHGPASQSEWESRADSVKEAFLHAWEGYEKFAWGSDELRPLGKTRVNNMNGWGLTIYDSLTTLHIMNLTSQYNRALGFIHGPQAPSGVQIQFNMEKSKDHAPFFETVIRYLGGLLSAHALTGNRMLLNKADELGRRLLPVFDTDSGLPRWGVNTDTGDIVDGPHGQRNRTLLAEIASCQLEFKYLAKITGNREYFDKVQHVLNIMDNHQTDHWGLWPTYWNVSSGKPVNQHYSVGAWADSAYEYLLKGYLMSNRKEVRLLKMYKSFLNTMLDTLLFVSPTRNFLYVTDIGSPAPEATAQVSKPSRRFEHLSCFLPGLLALGAEQLSVARGECTENERQKWLWAAEGLAHGCWLMYADEPTGLGPDEVTVDSFQYNNDPQGGRWKEAIRSWEANGRPDGKPPGVAYLPTPIRHIGRLKSREEPDYKVRISSYLLRPETIESIYIMYRTTGDIVWRERGWKVFKALEKYTRLQYGYASIRGVDRVPNYIDEMPSYALAETWKYLYLLFLGNDRAQEILDMDKWVFNTEAHPLPVFDWNEQEIQTYNIRTYL